MNRNIFCCILFFALSISIGFSTDVKSVQLFPEGNEIGLPIIALNSQQALQLEFDLLGDDAPYVYYEIQHFSADWSKKDLSPLDFIKGFHTGNIDEFEFSFNTNQLYTHYKFSFPNQNTKFKISGNYKILAFEDSNDKPLFEKKFYVTEQVVSINGGMKNAISGGMLNSHHQVEFAVSIDALPTNNPREDITAVVMQNGREDNQLIDIKPNRVIDKTLYFNNPFDFNFEAGNEFRWFNIRSVRYKTQGVAEIISKNNKTDVWLIPDLIKRQDQFIVWNDFNGQYVIDHQEGNIPDIDADYVTVHFSLQETAALKGKEIYLFGGLTNWQIDPKYKLEMNKRQNFLQTSAYLKQGNYDYQYLVKNGDTFSATPTEGSFYRTQNQYTVFIYHARFGDRYERLVGVQTYTSLFN